MGAEMSTSEVLNRAADLIEERGWGKGFDAWGQDEGAPLCLEGGILAARGMTKAYWEPGDFRAASIAFEAFRSCPAYRAVHNYLVSTGDLGDGDALWEFNDSTAEERVIGVLRATALIEAARERESVEV